MPVLKLTQSSIKTLECLPGSSKTYYFDDDCKGLLMETRMTGGKTWHLRYQDERGKTRQLRLGDALDVTLQQARQMADKYRAQIAMGEDPAEKKAELKKVPTLNAFILDQYLPFVKGYKKSWVTDEGLLRNHIMPTLGHKYMDEISKQDIITLHHGRRAAGAAAGSANRLLIIMRFIFNLAIRWETAGISKNPTDGVELYEEIKKERYLTTEEAQRLYTAVSESDNKMLQHIIPMLILTGARKREVLDARWEDFDIARKQWRIPMTKTGKPRYVPLSTAAIQLLDSLPRIEGCPFAFPNPKSKVPYVSIFISWNSARVHAGLADVRIHDLRHSFASFLVNGGRSLYEVQKILGHTQVKTTQRYAHLSQETLVDAANMVPNLF